MPLIGAHDVENVTVTGRGIVTTADYESWRKAYPAAYARSSKCAKAWSRRGAMNPAAPMVRTGTIC